MSLNDNFFYFVIRTNRKCVDTAFGQT